MNDSEAIVNAKRETVSMIFATDRFRVFFRPRPRTEEHGIGRGMRPASRALPAVDRKERKRFLRSEPSL